MTGKEGIGIEIEIERDQGQDQDRGTGEDHTGLDLEGHHMIDLGQDRDHGQHRITDIDIENDID